MNYKYSSIIKAGNVLTDFLLMNAAFYLSLLAVHPEYWRETPINQEINFIVFNLLMFYCASVEGLYNNILTRDAPDTIKATVTSLAIFAVCVVVLMYALPQLGLTYKLVLYFIPSFSFLVLLFKTAFLLLRKSRRKFWMDFKKIALVGSGPAAMELYRYIEDNPQIGYRIVGIFDDSFHLKDRKNPLIIGKIANCFSYVKVHGINEIYCALPPQEVKLIRRLIEEADRQMIRMRLVPDMTSVFDKKVKVEVYGHMPIMTLRDEPLENVMNEYIKRGFDILFSLTAIILVLSWLTPILAILIKAESRGPMFFRQLRSGKNNKPFYCLKFRSMTVNTDSDKRQASKGDARITRIGSFLRKSSLDELPQFINVLLGDMSVVGPRPHMLKHTEDYSLLIDKYMVRHFLTPGITGWAQVNGFRGETRETSSMSKRVDADIWYLENWSLFLDMKIVFLTVWQVFKGNQNAY